MAATKTDAEPAAANGAHDGAAAAAAAGGGGGIKAFLPLVANVLLMPVLAYFTVTKVLLPKMESGASHAPAKSAATAAAGAHASEKEKDPGHKAADSGHGAEKGGSGSSHAAPSGAGGGGAHGASSGGAGGHGGGSDKVTVPLSSKLVVNVAGTLGTRYLVANVTLVGRNPELKAIIEKNDAQLRDAAGAALASKTITDLERPGARNVIRSELISSFNSILGAGTVSEIFLTEFAIQ